MPPTVQRLVLVTLSVALGFGSGAAATEPDGALAVSLSWVDHTGTSVGLTVTALVPLRDVMVTLDAPAGVAARFLDGPAGPGRYLAGSLERRATSSLVIVLTPPTPAGAIVDVVLDARRADGRAVRERFGVPAGPVPARSIRGGAVEFPAARGPESSAPAPAERAVWTASGVALYRDRAFGPEGFTGEEPLLPIRSADVEVVEAADGTVLALGSTDDDGGFAVPVDDAAVRDVYVRVLARSDAIADLFLSVTDGAFNPDEYAIVTTPVLGHPPDADLDAGTMIAEIGAGGEAFNAWDAGLDGVDYLATLIGSRPDSSESLRLVWEPDRGQGTSTATSTRIDVRDTGAYDDTVILHEFGHWTVFNYSDSDNPGSSHGFAQCDQDPMLAWDEGHATFFGCSVRRHFARPMPQIYVSTTGGAGPGHVHLYADLETETEYSCRGATSEVAVFTALWDVFDDAAVDDFTPGVDDAPWDVLARPDTENWATMTLGFPSHHRLTTEDWWDAWFEPPVSNGFVDEMRLAFGAVGIEYYEDDNEPNDNESQATPLSSDGVAVHATFFSDPEDDGTGDEVREDDWYVFQGWAGATYRVETTNLWSAADTSVTLSGPSGGSVAVNDDRADGDPSSLVVWTAVDDGPYRVEVTQPRDWTWYGSYDLIVGVTPDLDGDGVPDGADADRDGDGVDNDLDCAPDARSTSALPAEVPALRWDADRWSWDGALEAHVYDVYRARFDSATGVGAALDCEQAATIERETPAELTPPPGFVDAWLVAGRNGCGAGSLGVSTAGERMSSTVCVEMPSADTDGDGVPDLDDDCPAASDLGQADLDGDRVGDACDVCPAIWNPAQGDDCPS